MSAKEDVKLEKAKAESQAVHQDFFTQRDKTNRGTDGLVDDVSNVLEEEIKVKEMLYNDSLKEVPLPGGIRPMFNTMFLTAKRNKITNDSGIYLPTASFGAEGSTDLEQDFSVEQTVMSCGPQCQQVCEGMVIRVNIENFKRRNEGGMKETVDATFSYKMPVVEIDGREYIRISERDVDYIVDTKGIIKT